MKSFNKKGEKDEGPFENSLDLDNINYQKKKSRTIKAKGN